jgi:preprotein translocase subunit SecE
MNKVTGYIRGVREELLKVVWPKKEEVLKLTATVVIITLIVSAYLGFLDYVFARTLEFILSQ